MTPDTGWRERLARFTHGESGYGPSPFYADLRSALAEIDRLWSDVALAKAALNNERRVSDLLTRDRDEARQALEVAKAGLEEIKAMGLGGRGYRPADVATTALAAVNAALGGK